MSELFLHKVVQLLREQLGWEIKKDGGVYDHIKKNWEHVKDSPAWKDITPEKFVAEYRLRFKPGYKDHPTGGVFVDGHYGEEGDIVIIGFPTDQAEKGSL